MPTLNDVNSSDGLVTMLKGEPGTRKSTCALSYPTPQYWVSTDQKMDALVLPAKTWGLNLSKDIHYDDYNDWNGPLTKLNQFRVNCPYKTIIVDSITSLGDCITGQVKKSKKKSKDDKDSGGTGGKTIGGITVSGYDEFNAEAAALIDMIDILKDIKRYHKIHIILIAHVIGARKDNSDNMLTHHSRVIVTGAEKTSSKISSRMDEVYHFNVEPGLNVDSGGDYTLYTEHTGNDYARTTLPLRKKITFNTKPLYETYIGPAIEQLRSMPTIHKVPTVQTAQTTQQKPTDFTAK